MRQDHDAGTRRSGFDDPEVVLHYTGASDVTPAEQRLFDRYLAPGMSILDLGVGTGRTARHLARTATRYVGADISPAMIDVAHHRFPDLDFVVADAAELDCFTGSAFDGVVFSFNGIDYLSPDDRRHAFLHHAHRVLRPGGTLIFSHHNLRNLIVVPRRFEGTFRNRVGTLRYGARATTRSFRDHIARHDPWRRTDRYSKDPDIGEGVWTHLSTRRHTTRETVDHGFELLEVLSYAHPRRARSIAVEGWYHAYRRC